MRFLKNHPFAVEAFFKQSIVLTFAVPKEQLQKFLPPHLELDTYQDRWAFIAVAMVSTEGLRPKGFPTYFGNDFFLIGYRIFVRYTNKKGKRLRGLLILKSETDKKKMQFLGNLFTQYAYSTTDITMKAENGITIINSQHSAFEVTIDHTVESAPLPKHSPFSSWSDARKFAGPLPHTFSYNASADSMLIIEGVRQHWKPYPIHICSYSFSYLDSLNLTNVYLANAFEIRDVPYFWKKGRIEPWR